MKNFAKWAGLFFIAAMIQALIVCVVFGLITSLIYECIIPMLVWCAIWSIVGGFMMRKIDFSAFYM